MTTPPNILTEAAKITSGDRRKDYGRPLINHLRIAVRWARRINRRVAQGLPAITPSVVVELMLDLKEARQENTPKFDNLLDSIGYIVCLDDMAREVMGKTTCTTYEEALVHLNEMDVYDMRAMLTELERPS